MVLRALMQGAFDSRCAREFRDGVVALKRACSVDRASRAASRSAMLAGMWALVACRVPKGLFERTHLGVRLRVLRFAGMMEQHRCGLCDRDDGRRRGGEVLRVEMMMTTAAEKAAGGGGGQGGGGGAGRLCARCLRRHFVPMERIRPFLGTTRADLIPCVWVPTRMGYEEERGRDATGGSDDKENRFTPTREPAALRPHARLEHVLAVLD